MLRFLAPLTIQPLPILRQTVREEVEKYAAGGRGANILLFAILDDDRGIYAVNAVDYPKRDDVVGVVVLARIVGNRVVIEEDMTPIRNWSTHSSSMASCVIRLCWHIAGEPIPDAAQFELDA